jgi:rRNA maturation endonuclease Nob1
MNLTYCKHCGAEIGSSELNYCNHCGGSLKRNSGDKISSVANWFQQTKEKILENNKPRINRARTSVLGGLDKLIDSIKDPNNLHFGGKELSPKYREKLAKTLDALKEKIVTPPITGEEVESLTQEEIKAEELITEELISQLRNDRCIICYADFQDQENISVLICPQCGQGGHFNHLESYIKSNNGQCPVCRQSNIIDRWFNLKL